jgi:photosystem II stability/assembly factor-like uncharacterized protein
VGSAGTIVHTRDGILWGEASPFTQNDLYSISCPSHKVCYAVGDVGTIVTTTDRGVTWHRQTSGTDDPLRSVSCPATNTCYAAGQGVIVGTTDAGATWRVLDSTVGAVSLACPSRSRCYGVGGSAIISSAHAGLSWQHYGLPRTPLESISCATDRLCIAAGGESWNCGDLATRRNNSARRLHAQRRPQQDACQESEAGWIARTRNAGQSWRVRFGLTSDHLGGAHFMSVVCAGATTCYVGGDGIWATTRDAGQKWTLTHPPFNTAIVLSCPAVRTCWAVAQSYINSPGGVPMVTADGGRTWSEPLDQFGFAGPEGVLGIACPGVDLCYAVGGGGLILTRQSGRP